MDYSIEEFDKAKTKVMNYIMYKKRTEYEVKNKFSKTTIFDKEKCSDCWAKFYCSGGCNANNYQYAGDPRKAHRMSCEIEKKRLECAIVLKAIRMGESADPNEE